MAIPKAVEQQAADAEQAVTDYLTGQGSGAGDTSVATPEAQVETPKAQASESKPAVVVPDAVLPPVEAAGTEIAQLKKQLDYEKHRNDSLQGRLDSQLRPLNDTVRDLKAQLTAMEAKVAQKAKEDQGPAHLRHVKPEEVETLGKDVVDVQSRIARGEAEAVVQNSESEAAVRFEDLKKRLEHIEQGRQETDATAYWAKVEALVPGASAINTSDSRWGDFLNTVDPLSGRMRREIGEVAISIGDVRRVADLMNDFKEAVGERTVVPAAAVTPPPAASGVRPEVVRAGPASQVPGRVAPAAKTVIRESHIQKFYDDWARGKFNGREAEAQKIADAIEAAVDEGRVVRG
jgi:hypothetical protein